MSRPDATPSVTLTREARRMPLLTVGIVLFLGSELMFFAALFGMYFTLRAQAAAWPPAGTSIHLINAAIITVILVVSSGTFQLGVRRIRQGDRNGLRLWVFITLLLGLVFLAGQFLDYTSLDFQIGTNAYGSAYYTMTGFHALHVIAGVVLMLVLLGRAAAGAYSAQDHAGVEVIAYYWHFVDVVWLALFATIFLIR